MKTIFKYAINGGIIHMPAGGKILTVQHQDGLPILWALVDTSKPLVEREIQILGTGNDFNDDNLVYIGTSQNMGFVWHFFEKVLNKSNDDKTEKYKLLQKIQYGLAIAGKYELELEFILNTLQLVKANPNISIMEAIEFTLNDIKE
jgi:hypothetical protein